jgi:hypothetical protein
MSRLHRARRVIVTFAAGTAMLALSAVPAVAVPPGWETAPGGTNSNGLGFCLSQVAQDPEGTVGTSHFGQAVQGVATSAPGAITTQFSEVRYPVCGGPGAGD